MMIFDEIEEKMRQIVAQTVAQGSNEARSLEGMCVIYRAFMSSATATFLKQGMSKSQGADDSLRLAAYIYAWADTCLRALEVKLATIKEGTN